LTTGGPDRDATHVPARVTRVRHWSDRLFSVTSTHAPSLRFENGQFIMVALEVEGRKLARPCSIASANCQGELEFASIMAPNGPLTSRLQNIREADTVRLGSKPIGALVLRDLRPGRRLFLLSTGTGFAPLVSLIRDPEVYERFGQVVAVRGARTAADLAYGESVIRDLREDPDRGGLAADRRRPVTRRRSSPSGSRRYGRPRPRVPARP
jgi:ferredoxin--NADP+ reductase